MPPWNHGADIEENSRKYRETENNIVLRNFVTFQLIFNQRVSFAPRYRFRKPKKLLQVFFWLSEMGRQLALQSNVL